MPGRKVTEAMAIDFVRRIRQGQTPLDIAIAYDLDRTTVSGYVRHVPRPYPEAGRPPRSDHHHVAALAARHGRRVASERTGYGYHSVAYSERQVREGRV